MYHVNTHIVFVGCCLCSCDELAGGTIVVGWLSGNENAFFFNQVPNYSVKWKTSQNRSLKSTYTIVITCLTSQIDM